MGGRPFLSRGPVEYWPGSNIKIDGLGRSPPLIWDFLTRWAPDGPQMGPRWAPDGPHQVTEDLGNPWVAQYLGVLFKQNRTTHITNDVVCAFG